VSRGTLVRVAERPGPARAEQSRAEQSRAEQSRAGQSRPEQSRAEQSRAKQLRAEESRAEQSRAEGGQVRTGRDKAIASTHLISSAHPRPVFPQGLASTGAVFRHDLALAAAILGQD
jgi:hypothetical protein